MNKVKNQHYIPQFYLKRFATNDKIDVFDLSKNEIRESQTTRNYASSRFFYDIPYKEIESLFEHIFELFPEKKDLDIFKDNQYIEHFLARVEGQTKDIFDDLEKNPSMIKRDDVKSSVIIFLHGLAYRTEAIRNTYEKINKEICDKLKIINPNLSESELSKYNKESAKKQQLEKITTLGPTLKTMKKLIENYNWYIGINCSKNLDFIISDNPAFDLITGFNDICIPISNKFAFIFQIKNKKAPIL